jgi:putative phosphoserine phosphatase/1-acylglycerol-3-phosphate O-acyltransferase
VTREAAFFDLDRTLLRGGSGPIISESLRSMGIGRSIPGEGAFYRVFELLGENRPTMVLTRQIARFAAGWPLDAVREAGERAGDALAEVVQPFARPLFEQHHDAGRLVVLATTTPYELVRPLAERLGFDDVIATRYGVQDGHYDGTIDGEFVWGPGKLRAVRVWAADRGVDLSSAWAYSDSWYDLPLLEAVGHPHAVNPDARLSAISLLRRWPIVYLDKPPGVPKLFGLVEPQRLLQLLLRPELMGFVRFDIDGVENLPHQGPAILVANHRSYFDPVAIGVALARRGRALRFLAKKELFSVPLAGPVLRAMGAIEVDRGSGSDQPLEAAAAALRGGELVCVLPQGTIPRGEAFFDPILKGHTGAARLAASSKAPVIPMGIWGTELVWPRNARVPNLTNLLHPPTVRVRVGEPVDVKRRSPRADTERIMAAISALLPAEAAVRREPSAEELERTRPAGVAPEDAPPAPAGDGVDADGGSGAGDLDTG